MMRNSHLFLTFIALVLLTYALPFQVHAAPAGPLVKHLSSLLKWTRSSAKTPQSVETVVEGNEIGVVPYRIRVSEDGELFAVDAVNSNVDLISMWQKENRIQIQVSKLCSVY
ncbi:hypothetical protein CFP56_041699, partial [Quercus suber]